MKKILVFLSLIYVLDVTGQDSIVVYFAFDSYSLSTSEKLKLKEINATQVQSVDGYTDTFGVNQYNIWLAQQRINTVTRLLKATKNTEIKKTSFGENFKTSSQHKENRKVVVRLKTSGNSNDVNLEDKTISKQIEQAKTGDKIKLNALNFYPGQDILLPEAIPTLNELVQVMQKNPKLVIEIQGHICCTTDDIWDLSTERAKRVYEYLLNNGISKDRMNYVGFGVSQPLYSIPEKNSDEQVANRRVVVKIISN